MAAVTSYATKDDILTIYDESQLELVAPKIVDEGTGAESVDDAAVARALEEASILIDTYIGRIVTLPFQGSAPRSLRKPCIDIALYNSALSPMNRTEEHRRRYEDALKWLQLVADGRVTLGPYDVNGDGEDDEDGEEVPRAPFGLITVGWKRG